MKNRVIVSEEDFNLEKFRDRMISDDSSPVVIFTEPVQKEKDGVKISKMKVIPYSSTTKNSIITIKDQVIDRFDIETVAIIQRVGLLDPGEKVMAVLISAAEREEAAEALDFCLEMFEMHLPIQKKIITVDGKKYWLERSDDVMELYGQVADGM